MYLITILLKEALKVQHDKRGNAFRMWTLIIIKKKILASDSKELNLMTQDKPPNTVLLQDWARDEGEKHGSGHKSKCAELLPCYSYSLYSSEDICRWLASYSKTLFSFYSNGIIELWKSKHCLFISPIFSYLVCA